MVDVTYVTGAKAPWRDGPAEGVESVRVSTGRLGAVLQGHSLYWLRRVGDATHVGGATLGYGQDHVTEHVISADGTWDAVTLEYVPDLAHEDVKLGWWRPGTEGRVE